MSESQRKQPTVFYLITHRISFLIQPESSQLFAIVGDIVSLIKKHLKKFIDSPQLTTSFGQKHFSE